MKTKLLLRGLAAIALVSAGLIRSSERLDPVTDQHSIASSGNAVVRICDDYPSPPPGGGDDPATARGITVT